MKFYIAYPATNSNMIINHENKKFIIIEKDSLEFIHNKTFEEAIKSSKLFMEKFSKEKEFYVSQCTLPLDTDDLYNIISAAMCGMSGDDTFSSIRFEIIETHKISKEE